MDLYQLIDASQEPILRTHEWIQEAKDKEVGFFEEVYNFFFN